MSKKTIKKSETEITKTYRRLTIEEVIAKLGEIFGSDAKDIIKMFTELDEFDIKEKIFVLDVSNTYPKYTFLDTYVYEDLRLRVSLNRAGRMGLREILKTPFTQDGTESEKGRMQKLRALFNW